MSILNEVNLIRSLDPKTPEEMESLILQCGLNNEILEEQPPELREYFGKGLKMWQYPSQLSSFASFLRNMKVKTYMEIGVRHGGTFIFINELLRKSNPELASCACDISEKPENIAEYQTLCKDGQVAYFEGSSRSPGFKHFAQNNFKPELVFIDGDHSYGGVKSDIDTFINLKSTKALILHDIVSDACPGVVKAWNELVNNDKFTCISFVSQYESVKGNFLGIGLAIKRA